MHEIGVMAVSYLCVGVALSVVESRYVWHGVIKTKGRSDWGVWMLALGFIAMTWPLMIRACFRRWSQV
jgi:hypothetical protein